MARSRYIKPEFFKDEDLSRVSFAARLLFVGLWSLADRMGRLEDRPLRIKAELFPYETVDVEPLLVELATQKVHGNGSFIQRYEVNGRRYIQIANFAKHQHCHPKEPDAGLPEPAAASPGKPRQETANPSESVSTNNPSESVGLPPADRIDRAIRQSTDALRTRLYALVSEMVEADPKQRDPTELMRLVTAYEKQDGSRVRGVVNAALLSHERLERSIADAEAQLEEWRQPDGAGA